MNERGDCLMVQVVYGGGNLPRPVRDDVNGEGGLVLVQDLGECPAVCVLHHQTHVLDEDHTHQGADVGVGQVGKLLGLGDDVLHSFDGVDGGGFGHLDGHLLPLVDASEDLAEPSDAHHLLHGDLGALDGQGVLCRTTAAIVATVVAVATTTTIATSRHIE